MADTVKASCPSLAPTAEQKRPPAHGLPSPLHSLRGVGVPFMQMTGSASPHPASSLFPPWIRVQAPVPEGGPSQ